MDGGAVVPGQLGLGVADLAHAGAEAAQVLGHGQGQVAVLAHGVVGLGVVTTAVTSGVDVGAVAHAGEVTGAAEVEAAGGAFGRVVVDERVLDERAADDGSGATGEDLGVDVGHRGLRVLRGLRTAAQMPSTPPGFPEIIAPSDAAGEGRGAGVVSPSRRRRAEPAATDACSAAGGACSAGTASDRVAPTAEVAPEPAAAVDHRSASFPARRRSGGVEWVGAAGRGDVAARFPQGSRRTAARASLDPRWWGRPALRTAAARKRTAGEARRTDGQPPLPRALAAIQAPPASACRCLPSLPSVPLGRAQFSNSENPGHEPPPKLRTTPKRPSTETGILVRQKTWHRSKRAPKTNRSTTT